ncbi:homeobox protein cut-like 1 isoform X3 [Tachypleus tridentatus]|uniref:homeobox protein cut-like 1 isoform X3 n=1 Tax=Tachypleus tridentatus TaxID=6853 RepID=UPI003FD1ADC7
MRMFLRLDQEVKKVAAPLLKNFQSEIDSLCKRSKAAEAAFLTVYKKIIDLPDPVSSLEVCQSLHQRAMRAQDLEFENKRLKETLDDYYQELDVQKNQGLTINQPGGSVPERKDADVQTLQTHELRVDIERRFFEVHVNITKKLDDAERQVGELQSALELSKSEFLDLKSKYDENSHTKSDEMEVFLNDLERANQRAALADREATTLKKQLEAAKQSLHQADSICMRTDMEKNDDAFSHSPLEIKLAAKDKEISQLVQDVKKLQSTINRLKETSASQIAQLEELLADRNKTIQLLEKKLSKQQNYEEMKNELNVLKKSDPHSYSNPESESSVMEENKTVKPLDNLLVEKDKDLESNDATQSLTPTDSADNLQDMAEHTLPPPLQNVEVFTSLLGEEIVSSYTKKMKKEERAYSHSTVKSLETSTSPTIPNPPQPLNCSKPKCHRDSSRHKVSHCDTTIQKLQECLHNCMNKYANESLDTLNISRGVRELLSVHNIGQRLFAKYVLGLSQGTVSELLSKPKPWDKLTEKGRDSYRKMHAWATDDSCIYMLKTLVPRKGKDSELPSCRQEDPAAKDRITQILNEAHQAMIVSPKDKKYPLIYNGNLNHSPEWQTPNGTFEKQEDDGQEEGGRDFDRQGSMQWPFKNSILYKDYSPNNNSRQLRRKDNDDISKEMITRIYQEELAKLMGQRLEEGFCISKDQFEHTHEEIRQTLSIYYQELSRLSQLLPNSMAELAHIGVSANLVNGSVPCSTFPSFLHPISLANSSSHCNASIDTTAQPPNWTNKISNSSSVESEKSHHHGSAFSLVRPKTEPSSGTSKIAISYHSGSNSSPTPCGPLVTMTEAPGSTEDPISSVSPLQRMQSITNSLLTQSTLAPSNHSQRPTKATLSPITQQQFDQYNNLNTEDIVKQVKEQLSQFSISQRLFGESVLGLSQGSVSDLLARPKPWHMLTQKGREPFIRMKIFLDDESAVHKLVASQYKIPPEKLMRTGTYIGSRNTSGPSKISPQPSDPCVSPHLPQQHNHLPFHSNYVSSKPVESCRTSPKTSENSHTTVSTNVTHCAATTHSISPRKLSHSSRPLPFMHPSVYEIAARTTDLDTQYITSKVKETLLAHNIGQKIFGEAVVGLSQGSVSELLSKPKPWHMLSIKGREPFIRMQLWLNDPHGADKLQAIKNDRREANKRKRNNNDAHEVSSSYKENQIFQYELPPPSPYSTTKKPRILFSDEQKEALRLAYSMDPYPSTATIEFLASELNLSVRTVTNWFHNYRMRLKQQTSPTNQQGEHNTNENSITVHPLRETSTIFDPIQFRFLLNGRLAEIGKERNKVSKMYNTYRSNSPFNTQNDNCGTLDLSMSSQHFPRGGSSSCSSFQSGPFETVCRSPGVHSTSDMNDDSNFSHDQVVSENSDKESGEEKQSSCFYGQQNGARQKLGTSSSNRRKPAMPQWVDPEMEYSAESDVKSDDDTQQSNNNPNKTEIINGVCVRQAGDFNLRLLKPEEMTEEMESIVAAYGSSRVAQNHVVEETHSQLCSQVEEEEGYSLKEDSTVDEEINCDSRESISSPHQGDWNEEKDRD